MTGYLKIAYVDGREPRILKASDYILPDRTDPLDHIRFFDAEQMVILSVAQVHIESIEAFDPEAVE